MSENVLTISDLSRQSGLTKHTLRYYEQIGLLPLVERHPSSGHRRYRADHVKWVAFLTDLRSTGMPIRDVREYAKLAVNRDETWPERREILAAHRERVAEKIESMQRHIAILDRKLERGCDPEKSNAGRRTNSRNGKKARRSNGALAGASQ